MKKILSILMSVACITILFSCTTQNSLEETKATDNEVETRTEIVENVTENIHTDDVFIIATPYVELCVPVIFKDNVISEVLSEDPYTLSFIRENDGTELFTLYFGEERGDVLGTLKLAEENIVIYVVFAELNEGSDNYDQNCIYQEAINTIIRHLKEHYDFATGEAVVYDDRSTFDIETPVVTLKYPSKWENIVVAEIVEDRVMFLYNNKLMFEVCFTECNGYLMGYYKDNPVYMVHYNADTDEENAIQEDASVIVNNLMLNPDFVVA